MNNGSRLAGIAVVVLMFAAGVFAGILFERTVLAPTQATPREKTQQQDAPGQQQQPPQEQARGNYVNTLNANLNLSDEQLAKLEELLSANEEKFITIHSTARSSMSDLDQELFESIMNLLEEDQQERFLQIWRSPFAPPPPQGGPGAPGGPGMPPPGAPGHRPPPPGMGAHPGGPPPQGAMPHQGAQQPGMGMYPPAKSGQPQNQPGATTPVPE